MADPRSFRRIRADAGTGEGLSRQRQVIFRAAVGVASVGFRAFGLSMLSETMKPISYSATGSRRMSSATLPGCISVSR